MPSIEDRLAAIGPGIPGRCPSCDGLGYIDNIDIAHRYQIQHCKDCGQRWEYLFDDEGVVVGLTELDASGRPVARTRVRPLRAAAPEPVAAAVEQVAPAEEAPALAPVAPAQEAPAVEQVAPAQEAPAVEARADAVLLVETFDTVREDEDDAVDAPAVDDAVVDLRDPPQPEHMSPAEWLRHSLQR